MNLLIDAWIPLQNNGILEKATLQELLCSEKSGDICLPRDDMEMACLQLLCAITQVLFVPENGKALIQHIKQPISRELYQSAIKHKIEWFDVAHPENPFMQFRGVKSADSTPMDKLLAGVEDGTNKVFVNPQGLADGLCSGCLAIALFNTANNCPSMGGGFKGSLRGSTPITILLNGPDLRSTLWLNVLTEESLNNVMPWYERTSDQSPNYVDKLNAGATCSAVNIGLVRGILWQPAHFEALPVDKKGKCSCCGVVENLHRGFNKEKFNYTIEGVWPHPLSSRTYKITRGQKEEKFPSFTTSAPSWIYMSKLLANKNADNEGYQRAPVIEQLIRLPSINQNRIQFSVGGYKNNQATILERRHDFYDLSKGWPDSGEIIEELVNLGLGYKTALRSALYTFGKGIKDKVKGSGVDLCDAFDRQYFQQTQKDMEYAFSHISFDNPEPAFETLEGKLRLTVEMLFEIATEPYRQEPKMLKALAIARRSLSGKIKELKSRERGTTNEAITEE